MSFEKENKYQIRRNDSCFIKMLSLSLLLHSEAAVTGILQPESNMCRARLERWTWSSSKKTITNQTSLSLPPASPILHAYCLAWLMIRQKFIRVGSLLSCFDSKYKNNFIILIIERRLSLDWSHFDVFLLQCSIDAGFVF